MTSRYLLAILLILIPTVAIIDGLAMAPLIIVLFLLLAWPQRRALMDWRAVWQSVSKESIIILLLLTLWPLLTSLWSIIPKVSLITSLHSAALLLLAPLGVYLSEQADNANILSSSGLTRGSIDKVSSAHGALMDGRVKPDHDRKLCLLPALGLALAALVIISGQLPGGGLVPRVASLLKHDEVTYLRVDINRGLCALSVLLWPAVIGLLRAGDRKLAVLLPWVLVLAFFSLHSLSAKTGLLAGMMVFYGMALCPVAGRRVVIWIAPLAFMAWPFVFHLLEPTVRATIYTKLPGSSVHRIEIWHFVFDKWRERPWLGWGVDSSRAIPGGLDEIWPGAQLVKLPLHPHNTPLHVLLEQGIIGFGLFIVAIGLFARRILPVDPQHSPMVSAAMAATLVAYLTIAMSGFGMWQGWWEATAMTAFLIIVFVKRGAEDTETPASFEGSGGVGSR